LGVVDQFDVEFAGDDSISIVCVSFDGCAHLELDLVFRAIVEVWSEKLNIGLIDGTFKVSRGLVEEDFTPNGLCCIALYVLDDIVPWLVFS
jgi:hypothetical protein